MLKAMNETFEGLWPGTVVDDADPDRRGAVRVRVPQVYGDSTESEKIEDEDLPWARSLMPAHTREAPPIGTQVMVGFWGGDPEYPFWVGVADGAGDTPSDFSGSYGPGPRTRYIRTPTGHIFEMRWVPGEEHIKLVTAAGSELALTDTPQGPKIEASTPAGYKVTLDEVQQKASMETPAQRKVSLDDAAQSASMETPTQSLRFDDLAQTAALTTPGIVNVTAGGAANVIAGGTATVTGLGVNIVSTGGAPSVQTGGGTLTQTFIGAAVLTFAAISFLITGAFAVTAAAISLTAATIALGQAASTKRRLLDERFLTDPAAYPAHFHIAPGGGGPTTGPTSVPPLASVATTEVTAA